MKKTINGKDYYIPSSLTKEQEEIYCHIIDWKQKYLSKERGIFRGQEYDAIFPESDIPSMLYNGIKDKWSLMQAGEYAYKLHKFSNHAVSSQTACINLFMPILLSEEANSILCNIPGSPSDFKEIARDRLYHGFCFEYWGQDIRKGRGILNDHSNGAGTDADVAIAYYNTNYDLCIWLIEHKLSEKEFTTCGGFESKANTNKKNCLEHKLSEISKKPELCHYSKIGYRYWNLFINNIYKFNNSCSSNGCPFREGLNQLWRNQILGFALLETGNYKDAKFSVCHHAKNTMLSGSIDKYKCLLAEHKMFSSFTNYDVLNAVESFNTDLKTWKDWYKNVYYIL